MMRKANLEGRFLRKRVRKPLRQEKKKGEKCNHIFFTACLVRCGYYFWLRISICFMCVVFFAVLKWHSLNFVIIHDCTQCKNVLLHVWFFCFCLMGILHLKRQGTLYSNISFCFCNIILEISFSVFASVSLIFLLYSSLSSHKFQTNERT